MPKPVDQEDRGKAAKTLVEFVAKYSLLLEDLLESVRGDMAGTVDQVMLQLNKANLASNKQKQKATHIIHSKQIDNSGEAALGRHLDSSVSLPEQATDAKAEFLRKMGTLDTMDGRIQKLMMTMMGALSADDVVGQRVQHTKFAIGKLGAGLAEMVDEIEKDFTPKLVSALSDRVSKDVYSIYTMEEEREFFRKIFGKEPDESK